MTLLYIVVYLYLFYTMEYFNNITNLNELKLIYRRLAMLNHPDMGGNIEVMKKINIEFELTKKQLINQGRIFDNLKVGDSVIINGSTSIVISVKRNSFTAQSEYTQRQAEFSKSTGVCIVNPKFKVTIPKMINNAN